jgi:hypothetical protein
MVELKTGFRYLPTQAATPKLREQIIQGHHSQLSYTALLWEAVKGQKCDETWLFYCDWPNPPQRVAATVIERFRPSFCKKVKTPKKTR